MAKQPTSPRPLPGDFVLCRDDTVKIMAAVRAILQERRDTQAEGPRTIRQLAMVMYGYNYPRWSAQCHRGLPFPKMWMRAGQNSLWNIALALSVHGHPVSPAEILARAGILIPQPAPPIYRSARREPRVRRKRDANGDLPPREVPVHG